MSFAPVLAGGGYAGWLFLSRTRQSQQEALARSPLMERETAYFEKQIGSIHSARELVADRGLLKVALGAFGLQEDLGNTHFIRRVLESGTYDPGSLANRLSDKRYLEFARAFGFGDYETPRTQLSTFGPEITSAYRGHRFEAEIGEQNADMRLALGLERALPDIAARGISENAKWFTVMGDPPLRKVFDTALGLPASFPSLDLDRQLEIYREKSEKLFGADGISGFADPERREALIRRFLILSDSADSAGATRGQVALTLLRGTAGAGAPL